jgi:hypothetical protein
MSPKKIDGIIETVRYDPEGRISLVRVYEKRGPTFSDLIILSRDQLIQKLRAGKKFYVGKRIPLQASTFELVVPVKLSGKTGQDVVVSRPGRGLNDDITDAPLF